MSVGLFNRSGPPVDFSSRPGWANLPIPGNFVPGFVVNVYWKDLQPNGPDDEIPATNALSQALVAANNKGMEQIKVRFFAGIHAPDWAMALGPGSITNYFEPQSGVYETIPPFWDPAFASAQAACMRKLVARYGQNPMFVEWAIAGPMVTFAEPCIIHTVNSSDPAEDAPIAANRAKLIAAGYTQELHDQAFTTAIQSHLGIISASTMAMNPIQQVLPDGSSFQSVARALQVIEEVYTTLGGNGGAGNNSIRHMPPSWNAITDTYPSSLGLIYTRLRELAAMDPRRPTYFQTATSARIGDLYEVCKSAVRMGATMIELPDGVSSYTDSTQPWGMTPAEFDEINAGLRANANMEVEPPPGVDLVEDPNDPGTYLNGVEDPNDPGTFLGLTEDPADPGTFLLDGGGGGEPNPTVTEDPSDPGIFLGLAEDPTDSGTFLGLTEDPLDPGTFKI